MESMGFPCADIAADLPHARHVRYAHTKFDGNGTQNIAGSMVQPGNLLVSGSTVNLAGALTVPLMTASGGVLGVGGAAEVGQLVVFCSTVLRKWTD